MTLCVCDIKGVILCGRTSVSEWQPLPVDEAEQPSKPNPWVETKKRKKRKRKTRRRKKKRSGGDDDAATMTMMMTMRMMSFRRLFVWFR